MGPAPIVLIGFIFLVLVVVGLIYLQWALLGVSILLCLLIALGFVLRGHKTRSFHIARVRLARGGGTTSENVRIEGRDFSVHDLTDRLEFTVSCRNLSWLAATVAIAIGSILVCLQNDLAFQPYVYDSSRYYELWFLCYLMVALLIPAFIWLSECALLRQPGIVLARVHGQTTGGLGTRWLGYEFTDPRGRYHGGSAIDFGGPKGDDLKVTFCHPAQPGFSKVSCGFLFHKIKWASTRD